MAPPESVNHPNPERTFEDALDRVLPSDMEQGALVRLALRQTRSEYLMVLGRAQVGPSNIKPTQLRHYEYPELVLTEHWLNGGEIRQLLSDLALRDHITLSGLGPIHVPKLTPEKPLHRLFSRYPLQIFFSKWPLLYQRWYGQIEPAHQLKYGEFLVSREVPLYPNERTAAASFVHDYFGRSGSSSDTEPFVAICEDRRARIAGIELQGDTLSVRVDARSDVHCTIKPYGSALTEEFRVHGALVTEGLSQVVFQGVPGYVLLALIDQHGEMLDEREIDFASGALPQDAIVSPETREVEVRSWIRAGEGYKIEFKQTVDRKRDQSKSEFVESVVAFANCDGGTIILGVDNHGQVKGFREEGFRDTLVDILHNTCNPMPEVQVEEVDVDGRPLTLVHVRARATGVVYCLNQDKIYVRIGATDRLAHKDELAVLFRSPTPRWLSRI